MTMSDAEWKRYHDVCLHLLAIKNSSKPVLVQIEECTGSKDALSLGKRLEAAKKASKTVTEKEAKKAIDEEIGSIPSDIFMLQEIMKIIKDLIKEGNKVYDEKHKPDSRNKYQSLLEVKAEHPKFIKYGDQLVSHTEKDFKKRMERYADNKYITRMAQMVMEISLSYAKARALMSAPPIG